MRGLKFWRALVHFPTPSDHHLTAPPPWWLQVRQGAQGLQRRHCRRPQLRAVVQRTGPAVPGAPSSRI